MTILHRPGAKHSNAEGLTCQECAQCKRRECQGGSLPFREVTILTTYSETLDFHKEYDIWQEEEFLSLQLVEVNFPEVDKLTVIVANTKADESAHDKLKLNWLGSWTTDKLRHWQDEDSAVKTWKGSDPTRPKWKKILHEEGDVKALLSQWHSLEIRDGI